MQAQLRQVPVLCLNFTAKEESAVIQGRQGQIRLVVLRQIIGAKLMEAVLRECYSLSKEQVPRVLSTLAWSIRLGSRRTRDGKSVDRLVYLRYQVVRDESGQRRLRQPLRRLKFRYQSRSGLSGELRLISAKGNDNVVITLP